jgi:hypothetical protein
MINFWGYSNSLLQVYVHVFDEHGNTVLKTIAGFHVQMFVQMLNPHAPKTATTFFCSTEFALFLFDSFYFCCLVCTSWAPNNNM